MFTTQGFPISVALLLVETFSPTLRPRPSMPVFSLGFHGTGQASLPSAVPFIFFPVVVHALDIVVSSVGILFVTAAAHSATNPMDQLTRGYRCLAFFGLWIVFLAATWLLPLSTEGLRDRRLQCCFCVVD